MAVIASIWMQVKFILDVQGVFVRYLLCEPLKACRKYASNLDWLTKESPSKESSSYLTNDVARIRSRNVFWG